MKKIFFALSFALTISSSFSNEFKKGEIVLFSTTSLTRQHVGEVMQSSSGSENVVIQELDYPSKSGSQVIDGGSGKPFYGIWSVKREDVLKEVPSLKVKSDSSENECVFSKNKSTLVRKGSRSGIRTRNAKILYLFENGLAAFLFDEKAENEFSAKGTTLFKESYNPLMMYRPYCI